MRSVHEIISKSADETFEVGKALGAGARRGDIFALSGELGCGKTVIAKGIARGMGIQDDITSPTFTLLEIYEGPLPLYHFDLYRIEDAQELDNLFFEEYWEGDGVSVIEWAERAHDRLPAYTITVTLEYIDETSRRIRIERPLD